MRYLIPLMLIASPLAAQAQGLGGYVLSADVGLGAEYGPAYLGSDDNETSPWFILKNGSLSRQTPTGETTDGFSVVPSFNYIGRRDAGDHDALKGMDDISRAGEIGGRFGYDFGPTSSYFTIRKGFGGHHGMVGEVGAKYRYQATDQLQLTSYVEADYGDSSFAETYFGVTQEESLNSGYRAYEPNGGFHQASIGVEARYSLTDNLALLGGVEYSRLIGDAKDSPFVKDKNQSSVKLGIVRHFDFRF